MNHTLLALSKKFRQRSTRNIGRMEDAHNLNILYWNQGGRWKRRKNLLYLIFVYLHGPPTHGANYLPPDIHCDHSRKQDCVDCQWDFHQDQHNIETPMVEFSYTSAEPKAMVIECRNLIETQSVTSGAAPKEDIEVQISSLGHQLTYSHSICSQNKWELVHGIKRTGHNLIHCIVSVHTDRGNVDRIESPQKTKTQSRSSMASTTESLVWHDPEWN